ncbi:hypothetical protein JTB14_033005 [Gonioctena quinquepunctata]|nr:hypothetical protein JTB14_033005 [Gonioctena quinquepunctata]
MQHEQSVIMHNEEKYKDDIKQVIEKLREYDPKNYQLFEKNRREREERLRALATTAKQLSEQKQREEPQENNPSQKEINDIIVRMEQMEGMKFSHLFKEDFNTPLYQQLKEEFKTINPERWEILNDAEFDYVNGLEYSSSCCSLNNAVHDLKDAKSEKTEENTKECKIETYESKETPGISEGILEEQEYKGDEKDIASVLSPPPPTNTTPVNTQENEFSQPETSKDSSIPEKHPRERTKQIEQEMKNQSKNPRKKANNKNYQYPNQMILSNSESEEKEIPNQKVETVKPTSELSPDSNLPEEHSREKTKLEQEKKNHSKNPRKEGNVENYEEIGTISGEGSEKGGEAGLVPRTYSMGAQPPSSNQPLTGTTKEKYEDKYLSSDSNLPDDYFKKRTKLDQEYKNQSKNPRKEVNTENYEDEYFTHLSNSECEEEIEQCTENFRTTVKILGQIAQQKGSYEPMQIVNSETSQNITAKKVKSIEMPPPMGHRMRQMKTHSDRDKSDAKNKNLYPKTIIQTDGPSDADNLFSTSSEEEDQSDLSMNKKNTQYVRNTKRRKTSKTKEELEIEQDDRRANLERAEAEKRKTVAHRNARKPKEAVLNPATDTETQANNKNTPPNNTRREADYRKYVGRSAAFKRLQCMERKMDQDPDFAEQYCDGVEERICKTGICLRCSGQKANFVDQSGCFAGPDFLQQMVYHRNVWDTWFYLLGQMEKIEVLVISSLKHTLIVDAEFLRIFQVKADFFNLSFDLRQQSDTCVVSTVQSKKDLTAAQQNRPKTGVDSIPETAPAD